MKRLILVAVAAASLIPFAAQAQTYGPPTSDAQIQADAARVHHDRKVVRKRIRHAERDGYVTDREAARIARAKAQASADKQVLRSDVGR